MHARFITRTAVALLTASCAFSGTAQAQGGQNRITIGVSPGLVRFSLVRSGISNGSAPASIDSRYRVPTGNQVSMYAYFLTPAQALTNGSTGPGNVIPSSRVFGSVNGGAPQSFTAAGPFSGGGSLAIFNLTAPDSRQHRRTDTVSLSIDTTGLNLRPGTYSGTLVIQAQVL